MLKIPSESHFKFINKYKVGDRFFASELKLFLGANSPHELGGILGAFMRVGLIKALFYRGGEKNKTRDVCYERIK